jgi:hypothetical protein
MGPDVCVDPLPGWLSFTWFRELATPAWWCWLGKLAEWCAGRGVAEAIPPLASTKTAAPLAATIPSTRLPVIAAPFVMRI